MKIAHWIKLKEHLDQEDYNLISALQKKCVVADQSALKLELDYKLAAALEDSKKDDKKEINEFMYFDNQQLVGYIGIGNFGGVGMPLELAGMVDPEYRKQGIFTTLNELVMAECKRRSCQEVLVLCDNNSINGQCCIQKLGAQYDHSEYEMYLMDDYFEPEEVQLCDISFRKAINSDAYEIARQNAIYFGDPLPEENIDKDYNEEDNGKQANKDIEENKDKEKNKDIEKNKDKEGYEGYSSKQDMLLPEEEEKKGMLIYLAIKDNKIVGKIHLEMNSEVGGIYGLGVLPEYRGKGYGRAILIGGIKIMKEYNRKKIMLQVAAENATALKLYKSCGFIETSTMDYYELKL